MILKYIIYFLIMLIPFVWTKQINGNYYNAKMFAVYFLGSLCLFHISFFSVGIKKIQLSKSLIFCTLFFLSFGLVQPILAGNILSILYAFKLLIFCILTYFIFLSELHFKDMKPGLLFLLSLIMISLLGINLYEILNMRFVQNTLDHGYILGTFGNVNMLAEFFTLSLPLVYGWSNLNEKFPKLLKYLAVSLWIFIVIYTRSRSSWIGLGFFTGYILFKDFNKKNILVFSLGLIFYLICMWLPSDGKGTVDTVKKSSFAERVSLYKSAAELIIDYPLGVGLGAFTNEAIPYRLHQDFKPHEYEFADQPHSEALKWGVQYGWLGLLLSIGFLIYLFISLIKLNNTLLMSAFLVLIPQILFQFPFENPASLLVIAIYFGLWLKETQTTDNNIIIIKMGWELKTAFLIFGLIVLINSLLFITSIVVESQFSQDLEKTTLMCKLYPINQRNCNHKNVLLLQAGNTAEFRNDLKTELNFSFLTSDLQRILPMYFQKMNDEKHLCENLLIYEMMYPLQKHFEAKDISLCQKYPLPFKYENPMQFRNDYRNWLYKAVF